MKTTTPTWKDRALHCNGYEIALARLLGLNHTDYETYELLEDAIAITIVELQQEQLNELKN